MKTTRRDAIKQGGAFAALLALGGPVAPAAAAPGVALSARRRQVYRSLLDALQGTAGGQFRHRDASAATARFTAWYTAQDAPNRAHADAVLDHLDAMGLRAAGRSRGLRALRGWAGAKASPDAAEAVHSAAVARRGGARRTGDRAAARRGRRARRPDAGRRLSRVAPAAQDDRHRPRRGDLSRLGPGLPPARQPRLLRRDEDAVDPHVGGLAEPPARRALPGRRPREPGLLPPAGARRADPARRRGRPLRDADALPLPDVGQRHGGGRRSEEHRCGDRL